MAYSSLFCATYTMCLNEIEFFIRYYYKIVYICDTQQNFNYMKIYNILTLATLLILGVACSKSNSNDIKPPQTGDSSFAKGADISWTTKMESEGLLFYNKSGSKRECTALMKELGMNTIRLRVWVSPADGWNNKADVLVKAKRAQSFGMRLMINFHYSDTWADPANQAVPSQWAGYDLAQLKTAMADHTKDVLSTLKTAGIDVEWVQVGNETAMGMMHPVGKYDNDPQNANYAELTTAGYEAVKSVYPNASVIVHLDSGENPYRYTYIFDYLTQHGAKYDMIGMSLYPSTSDWESKAKACIDNIKAVGAKYGKPVMICEVGMSVSAAST